jgi:hypothetical protein
MTKPDQAAALYMVSMERIISASHAMTDAEKSALKAWEAENLGKDGKATSDWPGWPAVIERISH